MAEGKAMTTTEITVPRGGKVDAQFLIVESRMVLWVSGLSLEATVTFNVFGQEDMLTLADAFERGAATLRAEAAQIEADRK